MAAAEKLIATAADPVWRRPAPWGGRSVALGGVVWLGLQAGLLNLFVAAISPEPTIRESLAVLALANASTIAAVPFLMRRLNGVTWDDFGVRGPGQILRGVGLGLAAATVVLPVVFGILAVALRVWPPRPHAMEIMLRRDGSPATRILAVLGGVILAPIAEELIFRGLLQRWLAQLAGGRDGTGAAWRSSGFRANLVASLAFAAIHAEQWPAPLPLFVLAVALGELYRRTGNLAAPIALHAALNGVSTGWLLVAANGEG